LGLFDLFARRPALSEGLEQYRNTSGAVLLDVRTPEEYREKWGYKRNTRIGIT
jgi:rhodanese-related sulfurtransferase